MKPQLPETYGLREVSQRLGVSVEWLRRRCRASLIPHVLIARQYRFTAEQVETILQDHIMQVVELPEEIPDPVPARKAAVKRARKTSRTYPTCEAP